MSWRRCRDETKRRKYFTLTAFITYLFQSYSLCGLPFISQFRHFLVFLLFFLFVVVPLFVSAAVWHRCHTSLYVFMYATYDKQKYFFFLFQHFFFFVPCVLFGIVSLFVFTNFIFKTQHFHFPSFKRLGPCKRKKSCRDSGCRKWKPVKRKAFHNVSNKSERMKGIELKAIFIFFLYASICSFVFRSFHVFFCSYFILYLLFSGLFLGQTSAQSKPDCEATQKFNFSFFHFIILACTLCST